MARLLMAEKVEKGAALLDREVGETWPLLIDVDSINQGDPSQCVLGQIATKAMGGSSGYWWDALEALKIVGKEGEYAFLSSGTRAWKAFVTQRQAFLKGYLSKGGQDRRRAKLRLVVHPSVRSKV